MFCKRVREGEDGSPLGPGGNFSFSVICHRIFALEEAAQYEQLGANIGLPRPAIMLLQFHPI